MKAIRQNWGGLWLWITTEVNEKNITQKGKWISKRRIKRGMQIIIAIMMLALFTGIGREIYIYKYPEQYFAYKVKRIQNITCCIPERMNIQISRWGMRNW